MYKIKGKPFWKSKTLWFNVAAAAIVWICSDNGLTPEQLVAYATTIITAGNALLRLVTVEPVKI